MYYQFLLANLLVISSISLSMANNECNAQPKNPCYGSYPDIPPTNMTINFTDESGVEQCFFEPPEDINVLERIRKVGTKFNITGARAQCATYGARLPQVIKRHAHVALCALRFGNDWTKHPFFKRMRMIHAPLGMKSWEKMSNWSWDKPFMKVVWDTEVIEIYDEGGIHKPPNLDKASICSNARWSRTEGTDLTVQQLVDGSWWSINEENGTYSGMYQLRLLCHLNYSDVVMDPRCKGEGECDRSDATGAASRATLPDDTSTVTQVSPTSGSVGCFHWHIARDPLLFFSALTVSPLWLLGGK